MTIETQDTRMEADIKDLGLNAPRVTKEQIDELMSKVTCSTYVVEDTTTTIAVAMLAVGEANFTLAMERTACIDKRNFNAELGAKYAIESAMAAARSKLWELEGYALAKQLAAPSLNPQQRVVVEADELNEKLKKLLELLSKPQPSFITDTQWFLLGLQQSHMTNYLAILHDRLDNFRLNDETLNPHNTVNS